MSSVSATITALNTRNELLRQHREAKATHPVGAYPIKFSKTVTPSGSNTVGDLINIIEFPANIRLFGVALEADNEWDTGGTAFRADLVLNDGLTTSSFTSAVGSAFTNQPTNDGIEIVSDAAGDTTQIITLVGTTTATDTVVVEDVTLNGTTFVPSVKLDWGQLLAAYVSSGTLTAASTVTIREASANQTITTLTPDAPSVGRQAVSPTSYYNRLVNLVASDSSTKQIGLEGTDSDGTTIYDSQALSGATSVQSNSSFQTVTYVLTGDLESNRTVTVSASEQVLVSGSNAWISNPMLPIQFTGAAIAGSGFGLDASSQTLALRVAAAATTAQTGSTVISGIALVGVTPKVTIS